jgi:hypothetical protein
MLNRRGFMWGVTASVGAMTVMSSEVALAQGQTTSLNVIYPNHEGAKFDAASKVCRWGMPPHRMR